MAGFEFRYRLNGGAATTRSFVFRDTETLTRGDILNLEDGEVDLGATGDAGLLGICTETKDGIGSTTRIEVIVDGDAVYGVEDGNARVKGANLDLDGATGHQGVGESYNDELVVVAASAASEETLVRISTRKHASLDGAEGRLTGGRLNAAIARAVVRCHNQYVGRGPTKAQAFFRHNFVVVVMENALTKGERSLVADGREEAVLEMRTQYQHAMRADVVAAIEALTGCKVVAFMSANNVDPDMAAELFVLDRPVPGESAV
jgi:uncharacterized protein YbcI